MFYYKRKDGGPVVFVGGAMCAVGMGVSPKKRDYVNLELEESIRGLRG